jgi:membrane-associated phospholipid phosphatase
VNRKFFLLVCGIGLFFFFLVFSYLVHKNLFTQADFSTTIRLQDHISRRFDGVFSIFSDIGTFEVMTVSLVIFLLLRKKIIAGIISLALFTFFHVIEIYGKFFVDHLPPPEFMLRTKRMVDFPQFHVRSEFSYPSGHSGRTIFLSVVFIVFIWQTEKLSLSVKVILICGLLSFDVVMLVSRIYLGEHWASDVIGGAILGGAFALISSSFYITKVHRVKNNLPKTSRSIL